MGPPLPKHGKSRLREMCLESLAQAGARMNRHARAELHELSGERRVQGAVVVKFRIHAGPCTPGETVQAEGRLVPEFPPGHQMDSHGLCIGKRRKRSEVLCGGFHFPTLALRLTHGPRTAVTPRVAQASERLMIDAKPDLTG